MSSADDAPSVVALSRGLALRRAPDRFQFLCPALWGDETAAPVAQLGADVVIAGSAALYVLSRQGSLVPHPQAGALTGSLDVVTAGEQTFVLRGDQNGSELWSLTADAAARIWHSESAWHAVGVLPDRLVLVRLEAQQIHTLSLGLDGSAASESAVAAPEQARYALLRTAGSTAYVLLLASDTQELGVLAEEAFLPLARAQRALAGPLGQDPALLAIDGALHALQDGALTVLAQTPHINCLQRRANTTLACTPEGIFELDERFTLARRIFGFAQLTAPDFAAIGDVEQRVLCQRQWEDLRFDLLSAGIMLEVEAQDQRDAGQASPAADASAGFAADARAQAKPSEAGSDEVGARKSPAGSGGCQLARDGVRSWPAGPHSVALVWLALRRRPWRRAARVAR